MATPLTGRIANIRSGIILMLLIKPAVFAWISFEWTEWDDSRGDSWILDRVIGLTRIWIRFVGLIEHLFDVVDYVAHAVFRKKANQVDRPIGMLLQVSIDLLFDGVDITFCAEVISLNYLSWHIITPLGHILKYPHCNRPILQYLRLFDLFRYLAREDSDRRFLGF